jgi:hypothetical protein
LVPAVVAEATAVVVVEVTEDHPPMALVVVEATVVLRTAPVV